MSLWRLILCFCFEHRCSAGRGRRSALAACLFNAHRSINYLERSPHSVATVEAAPDYDVIGAVATGWLVVVVVVQTGIIHAPLLNNQREHGLMVIFEMTFEEKYARRIFKDHKRSSVEINIRGTLDRIGYKQFFRIVGYK